MDILPKYNLSRVIFAWFILSAISTFSDASVIADNTRIIYPEGLGSRSFILTNTDDFPNVVQVWISEQSLSNSAKTGAVPFLVTPSIFRISPHSGQTIKIIYDGTPLPSDRESVFFFNFLQIPSQLSSTAEAQANKITLLLQHTIKLFYRPKDIPERVDALASYQQFNIIKNKQQWQLVIQNNSGFYANYVDSFVGMNNQPEIAVAIDMVAPYSSKTVDIVTSKNLSGKEISLKYALINDMGGHVFERVSIRPN